MNACRHVSWLMGFMILFQLACTEEQPFFPQNLPGRIVGRVIPEGIRAVIELYQGQLIRTTVCDSSGFFSLDSLAPGIYNLEIFAQNHGRQVINQLAVHSGQTTTIPDVQLRPYPEQILSFIPVSGTTNFPLTAPIQIQFATLMDHSSVERNFRLAPATPGQFRWQIVSGNSHLSFFPDDQFQSKTAYTFVLTTEARTSNGKNLPFNFTSDFTTEGVRVTSTIPENDASFVSPQTDIFISFNSRMDRASVEQNFMIQPTKLGNFKWLDSRRFIFQPGSYLASNTQYIVIVGSEARDVFGNFLQQQNATVFRTEPLKISYNFPENGATGISRSGPIVIGFNTLVDQYSVQQAFTLSPAIEGWDFQWSDLSRFQYSGTARLQPNTFYMVTIDTTCTDAWRNRLPSNYSFVFKTGY